MPKNKTAPASESGKTGAPSAVETPKTPAVKPAGKTKDKSKTTGRPAKKTKDKSKTTGRPAKKTKAPALPKGAKLVPGPRDGRDAWGCRLTGKDGQPSRAAIINAVLLALPKGARFTIPELQAKLPAVQAISNHILAMRIGGYVRKNDDGTYSVRTDKNAGKRDGIGWGEKYRTNAAANGTFM